jgi:release factor glutamine methyltransferase
MKDQERKWLLNEKYDGVETSKFFADLELLKSGTPLGFIIGHTPFYNCHIDLSYKPLIPRVETEYWVHSFVVNDLTLEAKVLDIFSGSGCVGIAVLKNSDANVDFAEIKSENIEQIKKNLEINEVSGDVYQSDVFESIPKKKYDFILANPPYIAHERKDTVQDSVLHHEDPEALFTDNDGLFFIEKLIKESSQYLKPGGKVYMEYDPWQTDKIKALLIKHKITNFEIQKDQYDRDRVLTLSYK